VGCGIKAIGNVEPVVGLGGWDVSFGDGDELLLDLSTEIKGTLDFLHRVVGLNGGADDGNVVILLADAVN